MSSTSRKPLGREFCKAAIGVAAGFGVGGTVYFIEGTDGMISATLGLASGIMVYAVTEPIVQKLKQIPDLFKRQP